MKIKCPLCGFENKEGNKFCKNCNEPQSYPMQDEPERKSHAANILSNN